MIIVNIIIYLSGYYMNENFYIKTKHQLNSNFRATPHLSADDVCAVVLSQFRVMSTNVQSCYIHTEDSSLPSIYLPNNIPIIIGRSVDTQIVDLKCSRNQGMLKK